MKVVITNQAKGSLEAIVEYYGASGFLRYGKSLRLSVLKKALLLKDFPQMGQEEETLQVLGLGHRYLVDGHYKIVYRIERETIYITDIFDTRQDPDKILED